MARVLQMSKTLVARPAIPADPEVVVRTYAGPQDIAPWLEIREQAFASERPAVRPWTVADFTREVLAQPWWSPAGLWLAEDVQEGRAVGTVIRAWRGRRGQRRPVVHWLAVLPAWRRRGLGRRLLAHLEDACWQEGHRQIQLETHAHWRAAVGAYRALGFACVCR
ncbi:MAG: GNAT family N-acetyltransferase [Planctomycetales bacterium]|nr:GNAT family N-acetyltransferase [Planctomycetales bacterium]